MIRAQKAWESGEGRVRTPRAVWPIATHGMCWVEFVWVTRAAHDLVRNDVCDSTAPNAHHPQLHKAPTRSSSHRMNPTVPDMTRLLDDAVFVLDADF